MKRWDRMSKDFTRIGKEIVMAVKEGGPNPDTNSRLRTAIQNGKGVNMPKDRVDAAIKRASSREEKDYQELEAQLPALDKRVQREQTFLNAQASQQPIRDPDG